MAARKNNASRNDSIHFEHHHHGGKYQQTANVEEESKNHVSLSMKRRGVSQGWLDGPI
jgi:hypothetical protein